MRELIFIGEIRSNMGKLSKMVIPGRVQLPQALEDWPSSLCPGSMNVGISEDGFPESFHELGEKAGMQKLDEGNFAPAFVIPHTDILNNSLSPKKGNALRGHAQVWRASIEVSGTERSIECWVLRRIGSTIKRQIEIVSDKHLKTALEVQDGDSVVVKIVEGVGG